MSKDREGSSRNTGQGQGRQQQEHWTRTGKAAVGTLGKDKEAAGTLGKDKEAAGTLGKDRDGSSWKTLGKIMGGSSKNTG